MRLAEVADKYLSHVHASRINCGHCYVWAWIVAAYVPSAKLWCDTLREGWNGQPYAYHAFPRIGNRFFDSESPQGVLDPGELMCFRKNMQHPSKTVRELCEQHTPKSFWNYWEDASCGMFTCKVGEMLDLNSGNVVFTQKILSFTKKQGIRL